jgi:4'-phosphopantetheinyl transferase
MNLVETMWEVPLTDVTLTAKDVHVWRFDLHQSDELVRELRHILSQEERNRADRFRLEQDRKHYIVGRGIVRNILGSYLQEVPDEVRITYGAHGKPMLALEMNTDQGAKRLKFNLSHSKDQALLVVTQEREVGLDLKFIRPVNLDDLAPRHFSPVEIAELCTLPEDAQLGVFYAGWTRKEAYLKALGYGMARLLDEFTVTLAPGEPARLVEVAGQPEEVGRWTLHELPVDDDFRATVCVEGGGFEVSCYQWRA